MTKIVYNSSNVNQTLIPNLDGAIENMNKAISVFNNTYVPYNFKYATYLNDFKELLNDRKSKIENIKQLIYRNNKIYDDISVSGNNEITMISNVKISKRDSAVR